MNDKNLDCCLYFKSKGYTVYLLTEDKHLSLKATIHEIQIPFNISAADLLYLIQHEFMMDIDSDHEQHCASADILVDLNQKLEWIYTRLSFASISMKQTENLYETSI